MQYQIVYFVPHTQFWSIPKSTSYRLYDINSAHTQLEWERKHYPRMFGANKLIDYRVIETDRLLDYDEARMLML